MTGKSLGLLVALLILLAVLLAQCRATPPCEELVWQSELLACIRATADSIMTTTAAVRVCEVKLMQDDRWRRN